MVRRNGHLIYIRDRANDRARPGPKLVWLNVNAIAPVTEGPHAGSSNQGASDE